MVSRKAYLEASQEDLAKSCALLQGVLTTLRAQYVHYQTSHWQSKGDSFYGNHLLFQRIYERIVPQVDGLAEKIVGMFGPEAVNATRIEASVVPMLVAWSAIECLHQRSLEAERRLQNQISSTYETLKQLNTLSLGMDDFLMSLASEHETNEYLIQQTLDQPSKVANTANPWTTWTFRRTP